LEVKPRSKKKKTNRDGLYGSGRQNPTEAQNKTPALSDCQAERPEKTICLGPLELVLNNEQHKQRRTKPMRQVEAREWWLWGAKSTLDDIDGLWAVLHQ